MDQPSVGGKLVYTRAKLSKRIKEIQELETQSKPPVVQELVLARRHLEDARMRLGVAMALERGEDPWQSGNPKPKQAEEKASE